MGMSATSGTSSNSSKSTGTSTSSAAPSKSAPTKTAEASQATGPTSAAPANDTPAGSPSDEVSISNEIEEEPTRSLPNLDAFDASSPTEDLADADPTSATSGAAETPVEEASPELSERVEAIQDLMSQSDWNAGPEEARAAAQAVADQLEGLPLEDRMRVLEEQGALGALSEHMEGRLQEGDRSTAGHLDVLGPFAGMLTPAQVDQAGVIAGDSTTVEEIGQAYNFLDTVREENPDPQAQKAAGRASLEGGALSGFNADMILSGQVPDFSGSQLTGLVAAADDPGLESSYSQKVENRLGRGYAAEQALGGHELRGERTLEEQIEARVDAVRDYQWEETSVDDPQGASMTARTYTDENGAQITESDLLDGEGELAGRRSTIVEAASGNLSDVEGSGFFSALGHDNPQGLLNELRGMGEPTVTDIQTLTERVGEDGTIETAAEAQRAWSWEEDGTTLTRVNNGPGSALEWELQRPIDEDGQTGLATQRFVQGSQDTSVMREYTDAHGFEVESLNERLHDISSQVAEDGGELPVEVERMLASSDQAGLPDLERYLGEDAMAELRENEDFQHLLEGFGDDPFQMAYSQNSSTFEGEGDQSRREYSEMLSMQADGRNAVLSRDDESGRWSFTYADEEGERGRLIGDDNSALEFDPRTVRLRAADGEITQTRTDARVVETGVDTMGHGMRAGSRLTRTLGSRLGRLSDFLGSIEGNTGTTLMQRYGKSMDGLGMGVNAIAAYQHLASGNLDAAAFSGAGAAMDMGAMLRNGPGAVSGAARMLGFAGAAYTGYVGVQQMLEGEHWRGGLNIATGVGAGMGIASGIAGTTWWLGPAGWGLSAAATLGSVTHDYLDRTQIADLKI